MIRIFNTETRRHGEVGSLGLRVFLFAERTAQALSISAGWGEVIDSGGDGHAAARAVGSTDASGGRVHGCVGADSVGILTSFVVANTFCREYRSRLLIDGG
jgi:hypothetical protein